MYNRFTRSSRIGRGKIPRKMREEVFERDNFTCQFCSSKLSPNKLTIDHLVPLSAGGLDEMVNYVTSCKTCNSRKGGIPLNEFAAQINIPIESLPVHGDPVIDNDDLPFQIRAIRKRIFDKIRAGGLNAHGKQAQKKVEKAYRREFWQTPLGMQLESEMPNLPGHIRVIVPEIKTIAKSENDYLLLLEMAKSANTRNLIGSTISKESIVIERFMSIRQKTRDQALRKRLDQAMDRYNKEARRRGLKPFTISAE